MAPATLEEYVSVRQEEKRAACEKAWDDGAAAALKDFPITRPLTNSVVVKALISTLQRNPYRKAE
jgi:hypothetical protein